MAINKRKPFQAVSIPSLNTPNIKRRYSVTQDIVSFRRCPRQYGTFNVHKYAPAYQTQAYFGTILHQVLDRCHTHFHGKIEPSTKGSLPDNGNIISDQEIEEYFDDLKQAEGAKTTTPTPPSEIIQYFIEVENGLKSQGIRAITQDMRVKAVRLLQYFNALEGLTLYPRVKDTEHRLQADRTNHILHGVVDLLVDSENLQANPADCEMWDYKGSSLLDVNPKDLVNYEFQMRVYAKLYELKHGVLPKKAILYFLNELDGLTCPSQRPKNALLEVSITPHEIDDAVNEFAQTVLQIEQARLNDQWNPATSGNISEKDCDICDLRWDCKTPNNGKGVQLRYP
ncbi:PD-(D/E)XK nuclease family protein [Crocosphaera sp. UHCC 0190]|uniref:PD-(D/E)XK nuclease family protein n=1 Tax=Crocosphaera sp. UHCC 0190 TaxID=3110246 RepID=UPI002B21A896|nr:PD-(D/E)XK nuclease family protein [Crocosphaera sp. UHCC 0190]MEA5511947.1 PD-(D/E)XK nuclease family protein [Crocosphaera sp. UHCC 0190]